MDRPASTKILSVLVSVLAWILLVGAANSNLGPWYATLHGDMKPTEWLTEVVLKYEVPTIALGLVLIWAAMKLWTGWRLGMGSVALFFGLNAARQALVEFRTGDEGEAFVRREVAFLLCEAAVALCVGVGLLASQRKHRRTDAGLRPSHDPL